jgi:ankyrin repeat protein
MNIYADDALTLFSCNTTLAFLPPPPILSHFWFARLTCTSRGSKTLTISQDGWTPLYIAAKKGHVDVVGILVQNGALIDVKTHVSD